MRANSLIGVVFIAALVTGCSGSDDDPAMANALLQYEPPSLTSRADFGGLVERRFQRLDADHSGELTRDELPPRMSAETVARYDADKDGRIDSGEWGKIMLDRFDRQDMNKDGTVTTRERQAIRAQRRTESPAP